MSEEIIQKALQRGTIRRIMHWTVLSTIYVSIIYSVMAMVYATKTIYKVKKNYAVVLERFGGEREAVTDIGWHARLPFFTNIEQVVPLMNQTLFIGNSEKPMRIISKENVALWTSGVLTYRINNLKIWAIENLDPQNLLQGDFDGIVKDILQSYKVNELISSREKVKEEIFKALKSRPINFKGPTLEEKYGLEVVSFVLKETRFGDKLIEATEEKKRIQLIAEAENYAADQEASRIDKLYKAYLNNIKALQIGLGGKGDAMNMAILQFLVQQKWASAYEKNQTGQNTVVIQNTSKSPNFTINPVNKIARKKKVAAVKKKKSGLHDIAYVGD
jgi:regulator of protease activity HflC (stomatin/prohibitin superfamily)